MEKIIIKRSPIVLVYKIILTIIIFDLFYLFKTLGEEFVFDLSSKAFLNLSYSAFISIIMVLVQIIVIITISILWYSTKYSVRNNNLTIKQGFIIKKNSVINFSNLKSVNSVQGLLGRIFDYGDIHFASSSRDKTLTISKVESPKMIIKSVENFTQNIKEK